MQRFKTKQSWTIEGVSGLLLNTAQTRSRCGAECQDMMKHFIKTWTRSNVVKPIQPCQAFLHDFAKKKNIGLNYVAMVWMEMGLLYFPKNGSFMSIKQHKATSSKHFWVPKMFKQSPISPANQSKMTNKLDRSVTVPPGNSQRDSTTLLLGRWPWQLIHVHNSSQPQINKLWLIRGILSKKWFNQILLNFHGIPNETAVWALLTQGWH